MEEMTDELRKDRSDADRNWRRFVLFRVLFNSRFYYPVLAVLFLDLGLSATEYTLLNFAWALAIVFTDLPAAQAKDFFGGLLQLIGVPSYMDDGLVMGPFYEGNDGTAIYNPNFRPFTPPVPFLLIRRAVISDWKFFLNNEEWLRHWARRYGEAAVEALADELRRFPWRARRD